MPKIEVLVGMVGSGKSTYARRRADEGALVVSHDDLTQMLHGGAYRYEPGLRDTYRRMEEALAVEAILAERDVVIDRTHLTRESRARWVEFRNNARLPAGSWASLRIVAVAFPIESAEVHAHRRFYADFDPANRNPRGRPYEDWLRVAEHHAAQAAAEPLDWRAEGFTNLIAPEPPEAAS